MERKKSSTFSSTTARDSFFDKQRFVFADVETIFVYIFEYWLVLLQVLQPTILE